MEFTQDQFNKFSQHSQVLWSAFCIPGSFQNDYFLASVNKPVSHISTVSSHLFCLHAESSLLTSCQVNFQGKNRTAFTFWHLLLLCHPTFLRTGLWGWLIGGRGWKQLPGGGWQSLLDREQGWWQHVSPPGGEPFSPPSQLWFEPWG